MSGEASFLDFLREAMETEGRGNDELLRAVVPLFEQVLAHHDEGRVAPLAGVDAIFAEGGHLWFHDSEAKSPSVDLGALRAREPSTKVGVDVVDRAAVVIDLSAGKQTASSKLVGRSGETIEAPVYLPGYVSWENEIGHHDALTDVFSLGMLLASLALGADFTEPDELERFVVNRHDLSRLSSKLHPVIAKAIVRMTELDRGSRAQDLLGIVRRLETYRDVDETVDRDLDFRKLEGFIAADKSSRRKMIQAHLQSRLFDMTKRNRLIWFRPTLMTLDLTEASVPTQLNVERISPDDLLLWQGAPLEALTKQKPLRLDRYLRFEETPYAAGVLDKIRGQAQRDEAEFGASQLRLVIAFFNWHNLRDEPEERVRSPLLLLSVKLEKKRGVRDSYVLTPLSDIAEVNPVLRHLLKDLYGLELPEQVDLSATDLDKFHQALAAEILRSEPGITLHKLTRPQIRLVHERARRRLAAWSRRSAVSGRGIRRHGDVSYSYARTNFQPLGLQLFLQKVKPARLGLDEHFKTAKAPEPTTPEARDEPEVKETEREIYQMVENARGKFDWALDLTHLTLGNFNYRKMSLVRDYDEILQEKDEAEHPAFDTLFSLDARELEQAPSGSQDPLAPFIVVPADPTQTAAVHWGRGGRDFIIQGPPGTGKSQTITNLISDFAGRGKRVLFVCEKRAALDVVFHRLAQHGLDELSVLIHDSQIDKKPFLTELGATYERWLEGLEKKPVKVEKQRDKLLSELREPLDALTRFEESMRAPAEGARASVAEVLRERLERGAPPELALEHKEQLCAHASWAEHRDDVLALGRSLSEVGESTVIAKLPLRHLARAILESERPVAALKEGLAKIEEHLDVVREARNLVRDGATADELAEALVLAREVEGLAAVNELALLDPDSARSRELDAALSQHGDEERALVKAQSATSGWQTKLARVDLAPALAEARRFENVFFLFLFFMPAWWTLRRVMKSQYDFARHAVRPTWTAVLSALFEEYEREDARETAEAAMKERFSIEGSLTDFARELAKLRSPAGRTPLQVALAKQWSTGGAAEIQALLAAAAQIDALIRAVTAVFDTTGAVAIDELAERVRKTRDAADLLPELVAPLRALGDAEPRVREAIRNVPLATEEWDGAIADVALERTFRANRPLARFDQDALERRRAQLREHYDAWLAINARFVCERVRARFLERVRMSLLPAAQLTDEQKELKKIYNAGRRVLEREFKKVMRHRSIRELSQGESGTVLYDLKPIWLMSPLSISDTIPLEEQRFDVVIFDEASQIPLEEAVPAVFRAPQMIVVGDEMQLPPTTFFAGKRDDDAVDDGEAHYDLDADSFLSHAARRLPSTMLGWHYRSRSEGLIRFSNHAFYGGKLLTVPDRTREKSRPPIEVTDTTQGEANAALVVDRAISFHKLNGLYEARRNADEATYIAELVRGLLRANSGHSIGIVAFSEAQQDEIETALQRLARTDEDFARMLDAEIEREQDGQMVGLFVKNLENVQGDERDVIILSICYAPAPNGKMRMNFGPINKGGGHKRLNVVFSRAKRHMAVVSSVYHTAITNEYNDGAQCFRRYLHYAAAMSRGDVETASVVTHALTRADAAEKKGGQHPVVEQLERALTERGYLTARGVGTSGFTVDLAIRRPADEQFVLGVLVDTERHYAGANVMERYHTRPAVLEAFDWHVEWVLAKDWLEDPARRVDQLEARYREAKDRARPKPASANNSQTGSRAALEARA